MDLSKLKLVIWDLDDTFWHGTLSEGPVELNRDNCDLVKRLVDRGVMNSICSKNDFEPVKNKLVNNGLWDCFVFPSVDWTPKAPRIANIIKSMSLRAQNVLFIDDNHLNLKEVQYYMKDINVMHINDIQDLIEQSHIIGKDDNKHSRLNQYRLLEKKVEECKEFESTNEFLLQSEIRLNFMYDCMAHFERIYELIGRTNQLNFTKRRSSPEELKNLMSQSNIECAAISVKDKYGDYGIVGFYALDKNNKSLVHFLFSCRTIGMGIEQYVFEKLGFPYLDVNGEVATSLKPENIVNWINREDSQIDIQSESISQRDSDKELISVLLKGPCDMNSILPYLENQSNCRIETEFNIVNDSGITVTAMNHSAHIVESCKLSESDIENVLQNIPFMDASAFNSRIVNEKFDFIFMSMLPDSHEGVYRHKESGTLISFSSFNYDLTDEKNWDNFITGKYTNHNFAFTTGILKAFKEKFEYIGPLAPEIIVQNIRYLLDHVIPKDTHLILMLGAEIECENQISEEFAGHAIRHKEVNNALKKQLKDDPNVDFMDFTDEINSQADFNGCTNHFRRGVYYNLAVKISDYVSAHSETKRLKVKGKAKIFMESLVDKIKRKLS